MGRVESKRVQRLYEQIVQNRKNCSFEELERLLLALDFTERAAKGSHVFSKRGRIAISIPKHKSVKEHYVEQILAIVVEIGERPS